MSKPQLILVTPFFLGVWWLERGRRPDCRSRAAAIGRLLVPWAVAMLGISFAIQWPGSLPAYRDFFGVAVTWHTRIAETYTNNYALSAILAKALVRLWAVPVSRSLPLLATGIALVLVCWNGISLTVGRVDTLRAFLPWLLSSLFWSTLVWEWYFGLVLVAPILMIAFEPRGPELAGDAFQLRLPVGVACTMMFSSFLFTLGLILLYCHSQALRLREIGDHLEP
jgi:hypothetical protein